MCARMNKKAHPNDPQTDAFTDYDDDENTLTLLAAAVNRLTVQKLGNQYDRLSAGWAQRIKKTPPPIPLWSPVVFALVSVARCARERHADY